MHKKTPAPTYRRASSAFSVRRHVRQRLPEDLLYSLVGEQEEISQAPSRLGPISLLPTEVLAYIFEHCLPEDEYPAPFVAEAPLQLMHVCSYWRVVASSTPCLWTHLHVTYKDPSFDIPLASEWLQRSGSLPLSLSITIDFNEQPAQEILDVMCIHSARWRQVRFEFRGLYCPPMYSLDLAQNNTPMLRVFQFDARDISSANITPIISLLQCAPNLREVTWIDDLADTRRLLELPLSRLTRLSVTMSHGTLDYLELLDQCLNLEHIRFTRPRLGSTGPSRQPLQLSKLTSLNIAHDLTAILDSLVLPALKHVRIHSEHSERNPRCVLGAGVEGEDEGGSWSPVSFLSLIERSSCTIESLYIDAPMSEACLTDCLEKTTSLTKLTVAGVAVTDKLLARLTLTSVTSSASSSSCDLAAKVYFPLCSSLREINFNTRITSSSDVLLGMVQSRLIGYTSSVKYDGNMKAMLSLTLWDGHKDLDLLRLLREERYLPCGVHDFNLNVVAPPSNVISSFYLGTRRPRPRRQLSARRRICQSR